MNFSEALFLVTHENEKVTRTAWQDEEWQKKQGTSSYDHGVRTWVMAMRPSMFGLPSGGAHDRFHAFGNHGYEPLSETPKFLRVSLGRPYHGEHVYRSDTVSFWSATLEDQLATDWEIAATEP